MKKLKKRLTKHQFEFLTRKLSILEKCYQDKCLYGETYDDKHMMLDIYRIMINQPNKRINLNCGSCILDLYYSVQRELLKISKEDESTLNKN